jgi:transposase
MMRGTDKTSGSLFSYVDLEERIPPRHPLRKIRQVVNDALASLDAEFDALYTDFGRPSIPPERLIRASILQLLFSVRSERQLMEQMDYNLMFRWFVGLGIDDPVWVPTVFTKNRDRLLSTEMSRKVMAAILAHRENRDRLLHRDVAQSHGRDPCASRGGTALVGRAFLGRRHAGESLGVDEEFPAQSRYRPA